MTSGVDHLFLCSSAFGEMSLHVFLPFSNWTMGCVCVCFTIEFSEFFIYSRYFLLVCNLYFLSLFLFVGHSDEHFAGTIVIVSQK